MYAQMIHTRVYNTANILKSLEEKKKTTVNWAELEKIMNAIMLCLIDKQ